MGLQFQNDLMDEMADAMEEDDPDFIPTQNFKGEDGVGPTPSHSCSFCEFSANIGGTNVCIR